MTIEPRPQAFRERLLAILGERVSFDFHETPLLNVVEFFGGLFPVNFVLDERALREAVGEVEEIKVREPIR